MKLHHILNEQQDGEQEIEQFAERVKQDCSLFLNNKSLNTQLYRGINVGLNGGFTIIGKKLSEQRPSSYSNWSVVKYLHDLMQNDGFKATRLNGYYTASSVSHASDFGSPFIVFPVGDYSLTWHEVSDDLPDDLGADGIIDVVRGTEGTIDFAFSKGDDKEQKSKNIAETFWNEYGDQFRQGQNVDKAAATGSEIMLLANKVHLISVERYQQYQQHLHDYWY